MIEDKKTASDHKPAPSSESKLTRIPVNHIFAVPGEHFDIPGASQVSNVKCYADPPNATKFWTCDFIPAWQQFEISYTAGKGAEPVVVFVPACHVGRWVKA